MRNFIKLVVLGVVVAALSVSCSKRPDQEISDVESTIQAAVSEGAEVYAKEDLEQLRSSFSVTMSEIDAQDKKLFKSYEQAKQALAEVKTQADTLKGTIAANKEAEKIEEEKKEAEKREAEKREAIAVLDQTRVAFEEAKSLLATAPKSKSTKAGLQALSADLSGLEASLAEIQPLIDAEDFLGAADKAKIVKEKIAAISEQIQQTTAAVKK